MDLAGLVTPRYDNISMTQEPSLTLNSAMVSLLALLAAKQVGNYADHVNTLGGQEIPRLMTTSPSRTA